MKASIEDLRKECIKSFAKVKSQHCLYDNYSKGWEDCIEAMQKLTSPKEPEVITQKIFIQKSNDIYFTKENYKIQIVDSEIGKNISDYKLDGKQLHEALNNYISNQSKPVVSEDDINDLVKERFGGKDYYKVSDRNFYKEGLRKGLSITSEGKESDEIKKAQELFFKWKKEELEISGLDCTAFDKWLSTLSKKK